MKSESNDYSETELGATISCKLKPTLAKNKRSSQSGLGETTETKVIKQDLVIAKILDAGNLRSEPETGSNISNANISIKNPVFVEDQRQRHSTIQSNASIHPYKQKGEKRS